MGFLHKLWDDTLAGPAPDTGLGKLRKYDSFSAVRSGTPPPPVIVAPDSTPVSRSITILRSGDTGCAPASPVGPTTPNSPFSPSTTPRGDFRRMPWKKMPPDQVDNNADPRNQIVYDWIVINALDR